MPQRLRELVTSGDLDGFESRCLELLEAGTLPLEELVWCFRRMGQDVQADRIAPLAQMVLENIDLETRSRQALSVTTTALNAVPRSEELRAAAIDLYRRVYGDTPGFDAILESSGLTTGGAARGALRVMDFCLALDVGDALISRMDGVVLEVVEVDRARGLFTLRRHDRATTIPAREVVRDYERVAADDFRVLRQLRPQHLTELIHDDPVKLVIGLITAHGASIDADQLKHELVPQYISSADWSKWWLRARAQLKRSPHIVIEGRSPVVLSYSAEGVSLEDETWEVFAQQVDALKWLEALERYLREQRARKSPADADLLRRCAARIVKRVAQLRKRSPGEALACALVLARVAAQPAWPGDAAPPLAAELLRDADEPARLIAGLASDGLWERALSHLSEGRPNDWVAVFAALVPLAPATQLDRIVQSLRAADRLDVVQQAIDDALVDVLDYPELACWLWKGPKVPEGLRLPSAAELFRAILDTLVALDSTLTPSRQVGRSFRNRMKAAIALQGYAKVSGCLRECSPAAAVTLRGKIRRLAGLGGNARRKLLDVLREAHPQLWAERRVILAPWEDPDVIWSTSAGIEQKTAERDELVNVKMHENAKRIGEAAAHGDLSENSEYRFGLEERDFLRARLAQINRDLSIARPISALDVPTDHAAIGTRVTLRGLGDGQTQVIAVLGPFEADVERGVLNYRAPVCQALMGMRTGERRELSIGGTEQEYELVGVQNALAPAEG